MGPIPWLGRGQKYFFQNMVLLHIKGNKTYLYNNVQANILPLRTLLTPVVGSKGQNIIFSESGHVAYQIKGNNAYNNMQGKSLPLHTSWTPGLVSKGHFFLKVVMMHIELKRMKCTITFKAIVCPYTHPQPLGLVKRSNIKMGGERELNLHSLNLPLKEKLLIIQLKEKLLINGRA